MDFVRAAGELPLLFFYFQLRRDLYRARPMVHGSRDSLSFSADGLDVQSGIPARLESEVQRRAGGEHTHSKGRRNTLWFQIMR